MENQRSSVNILSPFSCGSRLSYCSESCKAEVGQGTSLSSDERSQHTFYVESAKIIPNYHQILPLIKSSG